MLELIFEVKAGALMGFGILGLTCIVYWKSPGYDELKQDNSLEQIK
ncbi:MAG TPA: hypothetical protein VIY48_07860 [Candidatus Paceibacterota bacterium]